MRYQPTLQQLYQRMIEIDSQISESDDVIERQELLAERSYLQREIQRRVCVE